MRELGCGAIALCVLLAGATAVRADADKETLAIIDRAIKAAGGEAKLATLGDVTLKTKAAFQDAGMELRFSGDCSFSGTDRFLFEGEVEGAAMRGVLSPKGCWRNIAGRVEDANPAAVPSVRKLLYAVRAAQLLLPLKDKAVTRSHLGEVKVGGRPAVGMKATHKDHGEIDLYFDKETGRPAKVEARVVLGPDNKETLFEGVFSDYKDVEGMKLFTKFSFKVEVGEQKLSTEVPLGEVKTVTKLADDLFAKPE